MKDDYLWDRSGAPDPEVERLETLLGRFRHEAPLRPIAIRAARWRPLPVTAAALAAMLMLLIAGLLVRFHWPEDKPWQILTVRGDVTIDGHRASPDDRIGVGSTLRTGAGPSSAILRVARIGELEIGPSSEIELVRTSRSRHRVALHGGTLSARVWAPPFTFGVQTAAGVATDLGCAFTLSYESSLGLLHVTSGWVEFEGEAGNSLVPGGAISEIRDRHRPGTPYWTDAPAALREALRAFDKSGSAHDLQRVFDAVRPRDAMTLHHILERAPVEHRAALFDHLSRFAPPPTGVTREGIAQHDRAMLEAWRHSLGLSSVKKWWLYWRDAV